MEHRYSDRVATNINVLIYKSGIPVAYGRAVNGCKVGFFIETDFSDINIEQVLDVEFIPSRSEENLCIYVCNVRVVRKTDLGLGVEIEYMKAESINTFNFSSRQFNAFGNIPYSKLAIAN